MPCAKCKAETKRDKLTAQAKQIASPRHGKTELDEVRIYNAMVMGIQEYYKIATAVNLDCRYLHRAVMTVLTNRLRTQCGNRLVKSGRKLTKTERSLYGRSAMLRYVAGSDEPIYPIGYIQHKNPKSKFYKSCYYSEMGRAGLHDNLQINIPLMLKLMRQPTFGYNAEYADNRISLFCAQWGKCAVTGQEFRFPDEIHCHHKIPKGRGGGDEFANLVLVQEPVHKLVHAQRMDIIRCYLDLLKLNPKQMQTLNKLRILADLPEIE